jgi:hypothetical protein
MNKARMKNYETTPRDNREPYTVTVTDAMPIRRLAPYFFPPNQNLECRPLEPVGAAHNQFVDARLRR